MSGSPHYRRIRAQVLDVIERIPTGAVTTFAAIGDELAVPARHVASILAREDDGPWHRVLPESGRPGGRRGELQLERLAADGVPLDGDRVDLARSFVHVLLDEEHRTHAATPLARAPRPGPS